MGDRPIVVLLVPIVPASTGNGLAMRAGMLLQALAQVATVHVVVVPVSGSADDDRSWAASRAHTVTVVEPVASDAARDHTTRQLADQALRDRLARTAPLPTRAALAPPTLATEIVSGLRAHSGKPAVVLAMRLYLAPLGASIARELSARVVVDVDDDDGALLRALGADDEASAFDRLAQCWLPDVDAVFAASAEAANGVATRVGIERIDVVPNVVTIPTLVPPAPGADRLLFVGNITYEPNRVAARLLATEVLPALRELRPTATFELVGPHAGALDDVRGLEHIRVTGFVADVTPHYQHADVVVIPLRHGSGTRIKVLEAIAHRRPVVATSAAVNGLDLQHGREVLVAESTSDLARTVDNVLGDPAHAASLVERAIEVVRAKYTLDAVGPTLRAAVFGSILAT